MTAKRPPSPLVRLGHALGAFLFFLVISLLLYSPSMRAGFNFDDQASIPKNPHIRLKVLSAGGLWDAAFRSPIPRRPAANLSLALNYYLGGLDPLGYHLFNVLVHALASLAVFLLLREVLELAAGGSPGGPSSAPWKGALAAALVFAAHPLQTQAVSYIVQRMTSLAGLFYLLALYVYLRARRVGGARRWAASFALYLLALASKEPVVVFPLILLLLDRLLFVRKGSGQERFGWGPLWFHGPVIAVTAAAAVLFAAGGGGAGVLAREALGLVMRNRDYGMLSRVASQPPALVFYLSLILFPHRARLSLDHDFPLPTSFFEPSPLLSALLILLTIVYAYRVREKYPLVSLAAGWFFLNLSLESSAINLEPVFEHRLYVPLLGPVGLLLLLAAKLLPTRARRAAVFFPVLLLLGWQTYERNGDWSDPVILYSDAARKAPGKTRPLYNAGLMLAEAGRLEEAKAAFEKVLRKEPRHSSALYSRGRLKAERGDAAGALADFEASLAADPSRVETHLSLGNALAALGRFAEALGPFEEAARLAPKDGRPEVNRANALAALGRTAEAEKTYRRALTLDPGAAEAHHGLGLLLAARGADRQALKELSEALRLGLETADAYNDLGVVLGRAGRRKEAREVLRKALALDPGHRAAKRNLDLLSLDRRY